MTNVGYIGFLKVEQSLISEGSSVGTNFDIGISAVSWEKRALAALPILKCSNVNVDLWKFKSTSSTIETGKREIQRNMLEIIGDRGRIVDMDISTEHEKNFKKIRSMMYELFSKVNRPLRILVDISCIPKHYFLYLLGMGFKEEIFASMDILYSEGRYLLPDSSGAAGRLTPRGLISEGEWRSLQIPYMEGQIYAPNERDLYVAVGAEITIALPMIERIDPKRLRLLQVADTLSRVPKPLVEQEQKSIDLLASMPGAEIVGYNLHDLIGVTKYIISDRQRTSTCLAIGSKTQALAFGIASLADEHIDVVCRVPQSYTAGDVEPTGPIYRFIISDRFEPQAYL